MPRDADATRSRILAAAVEEFSAHGLAGGRVDRIAEGARANKRAIYDYFGSKEDLFDRAVVQVTDELIASVPAFGDDAAAYAGDLFDYLLAHPEAQRLLAWRRLERPQAVPELAATFVRDLDPGRIDVATLVIGLANAWDLSGVDLVRAAGGDPDDPERISRHRDILTELAALIVAPGGPDRRRRR